MKNKKIFLPILGLLSGLFISCEKNNTPAEASSVLSISTAEVLTRSSKDAFIQGDKIGVFVLDENSGMYNGSESCWNNRATLETAWHLEKDIYLSSKPGTVHAYYPYHENVSSTQIQIESASQTDFLFSRGIVVNAENPDVTLQMKHALSLVKFVIKQEGYVGEGKISGVSLQGVNREGILDICTGEITIQKIGNEAYKGDFILNDSPLAIGIIALPQTITSTTVMLLLDGERYGFKLPEGAWEQGKETTYTLGINSVEKKLFQIGTSTIDSWGAGGTYEGDLTPGIDIGTEID